MRMPVDLEGLVKIGLAIVIGGLVGAEREYRDKSAGFRTMIFICLGSTLLTIHSLSIGITRDQARIASAIVSGVGFLGGGAILRGGNTVKGLTTAATIWLTAALGMGIGGGYYRLTLAASAAVLIVLWFFPIIEGWIDGLKTSRVYTTVCDVNKSSLATIENIFRDAGLQIFPSSHRKADGKLECSWYVTGKPAQHVVAIDHLLSADDVKDISY
jgi:putative Mg2+ transporter-C (MgtC) family protein